MFIGHFAVGFAAKTAVPRVPLGTLFPPFIDLLWPVLLLPGIERVQIQPGATQVTPLNFEHYPVSHSLAGVLAWAAGFGLVYQAAWRHARGAVVFGLCVASHWFLDAIVHRTDLPLYPEGPWSAWASGLQSRLRWESI
jgi:membrane-bound metal-dependent hydrolase YbcI (DUF457 family)